MAKPNASTRVGRGKVRNAHHGRDQFGRKMSLKDRTKLLKSGAADIVAGQKQDAKKKAKAAEKARRKRMHDAQTTDTNNS